jgi:hypothetical protein
MGATMCHDVPWGRLQGLGVELNVYSLLLNIYHWSYLGVKRLQFYGQLI